MSSTPDLPVIHVVAAVLQAADGRVLICGRPAGKEMAGLWEFPGGKIEPDETPRVALARELREELHIELQAAQSFMRLQHDYPDKRVELDIWRVTAWDGEPQPLENQPLAWVTVDELPAWQLLPADAPIVAALRLSDRYLITPDPGDDTTAFLTVLQHVLATAQFPILQLRAHSLSAQQYAVLAQQVLSLAHKMGSRVLLNARPELVREIGADGVHLTSSVLRQQTSRPLPASFLIAASCHDAAELAHASQLGLDFAVLGPVRETASHSDITPLGWRRFTEMLAGIDMPVYGLGGLGDTDLPHAWAAGARGVAAIRRFWL